MLIKGTSLPRFVGKSLFFVVVMVIAVCVCVWGGGGGGGSMI